MCTPVGEVRRLPPMFCWCMVTGFTCALRVMGVAAKNRNRMSAPPFQVEGQLDDRNPEYASSSTSNNAPDSRERSDLLPGFSCAVASDGGYRTSSC